MGLISKFKGWLGGASAASSVPHSYAVESALPTAEEGTKVPEFIEVVLAPDGLAAELSVPQQLVMQVVEQRLKSLPDDAIALPRLPAVIPKLMAALRDPQASAREYSDIVRKDPALASGVLRLANSPYYNTTEDEITSIERGIQALGVGGLRSLLAAAVLQPLIHVRSPLYGQFGKLLWEHSLATAVAAELLAERWREDKFKAYFLGLIHEIGSIVVFTQLVNAFKENSPVAEPSPAAFLPLLRDYAPAFAARVVRLWDLPEDIGQALAEQGKVSGHGSLGGVLHTANQVAELHFLVSSGRVGEFTAEQRLAEMNVPRDIMVKLNGLSLEG